MFLIDLPLSVEPLPPIWLYPCSVKHVVNHYRSTRPHLIVKKGEVAVNGSISVEAEQADGLVMRHHFGTILNIANCQLDSVRNTKMIKIGANNTGVLVDPPYASRVPPTIFSNV